MKKQFVITILLMICFSLPAWAQDFPKAEVFGGFSVLNVRLDNRETFPGWQASLAVNPSKVVGLVADFSGNYKTVTDVERGVTVNHKVKLHGYMFGPRFNARKEKATVFAHALFGATHFSASDPSGSEKDTNFSMAYGGGVDVKAGKVSIRLIQFDWIPIHTGDSGDKWETSPVRFGFGVVIPLGK